MRRGGLVRGAAGVLALAGLAWLVLADRAPSRSPGGSVAVASSLLAGPPRATSASEWDPSAAGDPCRLLTVAQVSQAMGRTATEDAATDTWPPLCRYVVAGTPLVTVYVGDNDRPGGREDFARLRAGTTAPEPVPGLGDEAYWDPAHDGLHVRVGVRHVEVMLRGDLTGPPARAYAVRLASAVLSSSPSPTSPR